MPFPPSERVEYQQNPLVEVVCQLRFPPILQLADNAPADFQERIRRDYPEYDQKRVGLELPGGIPEQVREQLASVLGGSANGAHNEYSFSVPDGRWRVGLSQSFIALSTPAHKRWEEFFGRLDNIVGHFEELHEPAYYHRVGLRYRDVIVRSKLGLAPETPWTRLLEPHVLGEMHSPELERQIVDAKRELLVALDGIDGVVRIRHGLVATSEQEQGYSIDADFFVEGQLGRKAARACLSAFNKRAGRLFRWFIKSELHAAMRPVAVEEG